MKDGYKVKICGTTNKIDAMLAAESGADYFGVVIEVEFSKRSLMVENAGELFQNPPIPAVALVFHMPEERLHYLVKKLNPYAVQFLNMESVELVRELKKAYPQLQLWQSIHLPSRGNPTDFDELKKQVKAYVEAGIDLLLYDTVATVDGRQKFGGTGLVSDWSMVRRLMEETDSSIPVFLAGGIRPENVEAAIEAIDPDGVDLCSGVEAVPGKKDPDKIKALMHTVRAKDRSR